MPTDSGMAFVVIQHLSPDFKSVMGELLARHTSMKIQPVTAPTPLARDCIYLLPPKQEMVLEGGRLCTRAKPLDQPLSMPINLFFRSLARECGERAFAIVLSGTGTDGSAGLHDIHDMGGRVLVQSEESAKFDGMPRAAIATGKVDAIMAPEEMPTTLLACAKNPAAPVTGPAGLRSVSEALLGVPAIIDKLRETYGIDFNHYKTATITRRIDRRINMLGCASFQEYCNRALSDPTELDTLYKDLLIGVTRFFRDVEAFEVLRQKVVPAILDRVPADEEIRVWSPGCATGEEPYSLAIAFLEEMERRGRPASLKVFASDMHRDSLHIAAEGLYPESSMEELGDTLRSRYFVREPGGYRVISSLRKALIFSPHNLIKDPPFTKMDLVSCRNLLIYFQPPAQLRALISFHFSLKVDGFLFLGPSETVGEIQGEFETIDRQWKLYRKIRDSRLPLDLRTGSAPGPGRAHARVAGSADARLSRAYEILMNRFVPTGALINERREVVHLFGQGDRFLRPATGKLSHDILSLARGHLRLALSAALQAAQKKTEKITYSGVEVEDELGRVLVTVTVEPLTDRGLASCHFVQFTCEEPPAPAPALDASTRYQAGAQTHARIEQLEHDLQQTKESLQSTVEQLETSNEELQASNEELLAANEELQSTNEELHSVNEELYSVNAEHEQKIHELDETTSDLHNLIRSTDIGTIFVDRELRIRLFTPTAGKIFNLLPQDVGREITHITYRVLDDDIIGAIRRVINHEVVAERKVVGPDGRRYQRRATAYRDQDNRPAGVVLTFVDVTELTEAEERLRATNESLEQRVLARTAELLAAQERLRESEAFTRHWLNTTTDGIWDRNLETDEEYLSPSFKALFGYADHELPNHATTWQRLIHPDDLGRTLESIREHTLHGTPFILPVRYRHKNGSIVWVLTRGVALKGADGRPVRMVGTHTDITDLKRGEEALRLLNEQLEARVAERTRALEAANANLSVSELRYRNVTETLPQLVWTSTPDGACDYLGPQWLEYTGLSAVEQLGFGWFNQVHPEDREHAAERWKEALARGGVYDVELRLRRSDGVFRWFKTRAIPLRDADRAIVKWFGTSTDIDDLRRSEEQAHLNEERFREIVEFSPNGILLVDSAGLITMANPQAARIFRCQVDELVGTGVESFLPEHVREHHRRDRRAFSQAPTARPMGVGRHLIALRRDGTEFPAEIGLQPLRNSGSTSVVATIVDISDRIKAELDLKESLLEKETLLKEIHHRVKNNMQLLSSLLRLQGDRVTDAEALAVLEQGQNRVRSLALIHEKLYQSTSLAHIDFKDYLKDLLGIVQSTNGGSDARVTTEVMGDAVMLGVDLGVPLGLLVNELVSNSFKHAFPAPRRGRIEVALRQAGPRQVEVTVRDDGVGFPPGFDWKNVSSLGLHLVKILSNQVEASTSARSGDGVEFLIRVPIPEDTRDQA
jgi:two-component system CheB/CheR fusion protein